MVTRVQRSPAVVLGARPVGLWTARGLSRDLTLALLVAVSYYVAARLSLNLALVREQVTPIWPPTGIALVGLLLFGRRVWPAITVAAFLVNLPIGPSPLAAAIIAVGNTVAPLLSAYLLERAGFRVELDRLRDAVAIVFLGALGGMLASATVGTITLALFDAIPPGEAWATWSVWWVGDAMGVLLVAPFLLSLRPGSAGLPRVPSWTRRAEAVVLVAGTAAVTYAAFRTSLGLEFLVFPFLGWAAWRFGQRGAAPVALVASGIAIWAAIEGAGPFEGRTLLDKMIILQIFNSTVALVASVLASVVTERKQAREALERSAHDLEERVRSRTGELSSANDLLGREIVERMRMERELAQTGEQLAEAQRIAHIGSWEWDIPANAVTWSEELHRIWGTEPAETALTYEDYLHRVHPADRDLAGQVVKRAFVERAPFSFDHRVLRPDGTVRWVHSRGTVAMGAGGDPIRMAGTAQDITERKLAEQWLERLATIVQSSDDAIISEDAHGTIISWNPAAERLYGYGDVEAIGRDVAILVPPDREHELAGMLDRIGRGEAIEQLDTVRVRKDGRMIDVSLTVSPHTDAAGRVIGASTITRDITARKRQQDVLHAAEERFRSAFENAPTGMALIGLDGGLFQVNHALCELLGVPEEDLLGTNMADIAHPDDVAAATTTREAMWSGELRTDRGRQHRLLRADGSYVWALVSLSLLTESDGLPMYFIAQVQDRTASREVELKLAHQALHDPLTGLPNRKLFMDRVKQALARSHRNSTWVAVLFLDLDQFKLLNDSLGHDAGDRALTVVAQRIRDVLRRSDSAGRFGGDEFVMLCEDLHSGMEAVEIAGRVARAIAPPFEIDGRDIELTASVGIAIASEPGATPEGLLREADTAMYRAKERGRARYEIFDDAMRRRTLKRLATEADLRVAIDRDQLRVFYQPQVNLATGSVAGFEALVRWDHPDRGLVYPNDFISVAEETGMIVPLGRWVVETACREAGTWPSGRRSQSPSPLIAVNLSPRQLSDRGLVESVARALAEAGVDATSLCLEVTESALMETSESGLESLRALHEHGVSLGIDDFGTGYSSFTRLSQLHPDVLKLDRSFIKRLGTDQESSAIVEAVIRLAHSLGLIAIAEGVETQEQLRRLRDLGCDRAQGYLFAPAQPPAEARRMLVG